MTWSWSEVHFMVPKAHRNLNVASNRPSGQHGICCSGSLLVSDFPFMWRRRREQANVSLLPILLVILTYNEQYCNVIHITRFNPKNKTNMWPDWCFTWSFETVIRCLERRCVSSQSDSRAKEKSGENTNKSFKSLFCGDLTWNSLLF